MSAASLEQPPQPLPGTCATPAYPSLLRAGRLEGRVVLEYVVDTLGRVEPATIQTVSSSHSQFEQSARRAVLTCRFRPARQGERAVRTLVRTPYNFSLRSS